MHPTHWLISTQVHAKCIFRDALGAVPRDAPMLISLDSTRIMEDEGLEDVFGADVAAKLTGVAPAVRVRRPSSGLQLITGGRVDGV